MINCMPVLNLMCVGGFNVILDQIYFFARMTIVSHNDVTEQSRFWKVKEDEKLKTCVKFYTRRWPLRNFSYAFFYKYLFIKIPLFWNLNSSVWVLRRRRHFIFCIPKNVDCIYTAGQLEKRN